MQKEYLTILLEEMNSKFGLVLEGHEALRSEIRGARDESNAKHEHTAFLINVLNDKIDAVEERLDKKIDVVEEKLSKKIDGVAADLQATDKRLSDKIDGVAADLQATDKRLSDKIDGVAAGLKAHRADTEAHGDAGLYVVRDSE